MTGFTPRRTCLFTGLFHFTMAALALFHELFLLNLPLLFQGFNNSCRLRKQCMPDIAVFQCVLVGDMRKRYLAGLSPKEDYILSPFIYRGNRR